ncbi:MAG: hypothetical protein RL365_807 [Bacteroidota bacterium]
MLTLQAASRPKRRGSLSFPYKHTFEGVFHKKTLTLLRISGFKKRRRLTLPPSKGQYHQRKQA